MFFTYAFIPQNVMWHRSRFFICKGLLTVLGSVVISCSNHSTSRNEDADNTLTEYQEQLISDGWHFQNSIYSGGLSDKFGVKSKYGQHDNYFDIEMGRGCDVAIKIINKATQDCIRYVFVPENTTVNIQMIPQGEYYLKLAYGKDWMEFEYEDGTVIGKFTDNVSYEKSVDTFDFGAKNSEEIISNILRINVKEQQLLHNFNTVSISEDEFMK